MEKLLHMFFENHTTITTKHQQFCEITNASFSVDSK
jgi:hypothetical protein